MTDESPDRTIRLAKVTHVLRQPNLLLFSLATHLNIQRALRRRFISEWKQLCGNRISMFSYLNYDYWLVVFPQRRLRKQNSVTVISGLDSFRKIWHAARGVYSHVLIVSCNHMMIQPEKMIMLSDSISLPLFHSAVLKSGMIICT